MNSVCGTRAIKNAKRIRTLAPHLIPAKEPANGFSSIIRFDILSTIHKMSDVDLATKLKGQAELTAVAKQLRTKPPNIKLFGDSPFKGTLHFVRLTLFVEANGSAVAPTRGDIQTAIQYTQMALPAMSAYCSQYGNNSLSVAPDILEFGVAVVSPRFNDDALQGWVNDIISQNHLPKDSSCLIFLNTPSSLNTDGDPQKGVGGYHDKADATYCFVNLNKEGLTVDDRGGNYASSLSHEICEMVCDPGVSFFNYEVCDACAGNCKNDWQNYFLEPSPSLGNSYVQSNKGIPPGVAFTFYTAAVARPGHANDCPASGSACGYPPPRPVGISELLYYDRQAGAGEFYAVDQSAGINIQFQETGWRQSWAQIINGKFSARDGFGSDLLFYDPAGGTGEFYKTDAQGGMSLTQSHKDWPTNWTHIVPGHFSNNGFDDLLFFNRAKGYGEFWHTDGKGGINRLGGGHSNWRNSWTLIIPGKFSDGPYTDLLFYDPAAGTGEFWKCDGKGNISLFGSHTNWRKDWSLIVPGNFSGGKYTDLLFYEPSSGTGEFWKTDGKGNTSLTGANNDWRKDWTQIIPGNFANSGHTDLLFYEQSTGTGEFWKTDGKGHVARIRSYTDWRKSWNIILNVV